MEKERESRDSVASKGEATLSEATNIMEKEQQDYKFRTVANHITNAPGHGDVPDQTVVKSKSATVTHVVTADSVQAEEVPTIPLESLQTISALQPEISVHSVASTRIVHIPMPLVAQPSEYRRGPGEWLQVWWEGMRPSYLPLSLLPVLLGSALAWTQTISSHTPLGTFRIAGFVGTIVVLFLLQMGAHLVNDYYDYLRGVDTSNALGPGGLIQQGLIRPTRVLSIGLVFLGLGALGGLFVASSGGAILYLFGLIGLVCAYFYSAPPRALAALGLGELLAFVIFGPLITLGAYAVQVGHETNSVFMYSLPLGLLAAAIIHVNNMRDTEGDAHAGKHTIASFVGIQWSRVWFMLLVLGAYAILILLGIPHKAPHLILVALWTFPLLIVIISGILRTDTPAGFHLVMHQTLRLETYFTLLLAFALIILALWPVFVHLPASILPI